MKFKSFLLVVICFLVVTNIFTQDIKKSKKDKNKKTKVENTQPENTQNPSENKELPSAITEIVKEPTNEKSTTPEVAPTPQTVANTKVNDVESFRYKIGLLDSIQVDVYRHPELSGTVSVSEKGTIMLPRLTKPIAVVCKTETQVANEIRDNLKSFLREPYVTARVTQQNSQPFAVIGAVEKPGNFALNRSVTLLELISLAGGPDGEKAGTKVQVARLGGVSGCDQNDNSAGSDDKLADNLFAFYKLNDVYKGITNPRMRPGDIVRVLEAEEFYVVGNVNKPQVIKFKEGMTVSDAVASAGGFLPASKKDKVTVKRKENGETVYLTVDINKIEKKLAKDVEIQPEDIIFVPTDKIKEGLFDLKKAITQGISTILRPF